MIFFKVFYWIVSLLMTASIFAEPKIVVVGAGLAGLTTAYRLQQKGLEVHVYEARGRVGGRILSAKIGNDIVELGGQNITDGGDAENIRRFIDELRLECIEHKIKIDCHYFNEKTGMLECPLNQKKIDLENLKSQLDKIAQKAHNMRDVLDGILQEEDSLYKLLAVRFSGYEGASIEKLSPWYTDTLYHMLLGGVSAAHQSADSDRKSLNLVSIQGGNALLPEKLAQLLGEKVHLNMSLVAVSKTVDNSYELVFQNGQTVKADILVLAIPCSVYEDIIFEGNLIPEERLAAIKNIPYGTNAKILVPCSQLPAKRSAFFNDRIASYISNPSVLTLYYTGEAARFSENTILKAYQQERPMLENAWGDFCPSFAAPAFARDESFVSYEGPIGYSWPNDPYVKGSYSYLAPGQEALFTATQTEEEESIRTLFAPIDHTLYFAGEHASILMEVPGTMEAACESGERTARMIVQWQL